MTEVIHIPESERGHIHVFSLAMRPEQARFLREPGALAQVLGIEEIDLYFSHWPDPTAEHADTLGAYDRLLKAGKIRAIGASNYDAALLQSALDVAEAEGLPAYQVIQPGYNLHDRAAFEGPLRDQLLSRPIARGNRLSVYSSPRASAFSRFTSANTSSL